MTARARWIVVGVTLLLVLGVVGLYWFNSNLTNVRLSELQGHRTWDIRSGDSVTLSADDVREGDWYTCSYLGHRPVAAPSPGHRIASPAINGVVTVEKAGDGDVSVTCEEGVALP